MWLTLVNVLKFFLILFVVNFAVIRNATANKISFRQAQAVRQDVEIYKDKNFDSEIISSISPGKFYYISNTTFGPFYKIKINNKIVGYVSDIDIEIKGLGRIKEKAFIDDVAEPTNKKNKKKSQAPPDEEEEDQSEDESVIHTSYQGFILNLVNYHEKTMDQNQVADLFAVGYRYIPYLSDFSASISWDVNLAYGIPSYYKEKLAVSGQGITVWSGAQLINITPLGQNKTLRYGLGPFAKYANYNLSTAVQKYSLQELSVGLLIEAGFIFHLDLISFDLGLRYYWERETYGGLSLGFLF